MAKRVARGGDEPTYALGAVTRLTGLNEHVLRAWERRYRAVEPRRSPGGTRRYSEADVERLRLLAAAVSAGNPIGDVARLSNEALRKRAAVPPPAAPAALPAALEAIRALDLAGAERLVSQQLAALGPVHFAREFALPLLRAIGDDWQAQRLCVASEHMASALLRSLLGGALRPGTSTAHGPRIVFAAPSGERHELGVLVAALTAQAAGGNALFLGADLPAEELLRAVEATDAAALVLGFTVLGPREALRELRRLRSALAPDVELWVGGPGASGLDLPDGVRALADLDQLERKIELLAVRRSS